MISTTGLGLPEAPLLLPDGSSVTNRGPLERVPMLGKASTDVAFGRPGRKRTYLAGDEPRQMEVHDVGVEDLELHD